MGQFERIYLVGNGRTADDSMSYEELMKAAESAEEKTFLSMLVIRRFEENLLRLFSENKLFGTTHTCIGQEAIAVSIMSHINDDDYVFSNHRCHGHFIAYSHRPDLLIREIMGKAGSLCDGRGGSQHIHYRNFYTNGVQGGIVPNAVGAALTAKRKGQGNISVVFLGDGTLGQGVVYESMNIAALMKLPVLFVVENNGYAMSTRTEDAVSGDIKARAEAFGIEASEVDGNDVEVLEKVAGEAFMKIREGLQPYMLVCNTYRLAAHSKGDDFRPEEEVEEHRKHDPLLFYMANLGNDRHLKLEAVVDKYIKSITEAAESEKFAVLRKPDSKKHAEIDIISVSSQKRYSDYINMALCEALENPDTIIMGEDIEDPYGGAFKVTKGLSTKYPEKVINTPISEAAITGIAVGASLTGTRVITEMMFGDFVTLGFDQLLNHASKYGWVYGDGTHVPMIMRTPMGGGRGYGPTHSQSLEKYLVGIPDVNVVALSRLHNPVYVYRYILSQENPTVVIENKLLYARPLLEKNQSGMIENFLVREVRNHLVPSYLLSYNSDFSNDVTLITYGGMVQDCMEAAETLMIDDELSVNIMVIGQLSEVPVKDFLEIRSLMDTVVFVEEGTISYGVGGEIITCLVENGVGKDYSRIASPDTPLPNSLLEEKEILPHKETIVRKVRAIR